MQNYTRIPNTMAKRIKGVKNSKTDSVIVTCKMHTYNLHRTSKNNVTVVFQSIIQRRN